MLCPIVFSANYKLYSLSSHNDQSIQFTPIHVEEAQSLPCSAGGIASHIPVVHVNAEGQRPLHSYILN